MKILLIDDSKTMRNIQKKVLTEMGGVEFTEAADGLEGLAAVSAQPGGYDVILVDWNMPNMDGITFLAKVREKDKKTPIIMATTEAEKGRVLEAIRTGASNYVVKPFTADVLMEKVKATLEKAKAAAAVAA